jgi:hypothetical protein
MGTNFEPIVVNAVLVIVLGFFIKVWINGIKEAIQKIEDELENKVDKALCDRAHFLVDRFSHTHGQHGAAGETIDQSRNR